MRYLLKKQFIPVATMAAVCTGLLPIAFPQVAFAGKFVRECNKQTPPSNWTEKDRAIARISCYGDKRQEIIQTKNDLKRLKKAIDQIRGEKLPGTSEKHKCVVGFFPYTMHKINFKVSGTIYKVRFKVKGGACSKYWNDARAAWKEHIRLYCHLNWPSSNEDVKKFNKLSDQYQKKYLSCFDKNIPKDIQNGFSITDRKTFKEYYTKTRSYWKDNLLGREYMNLSRACKRTLEGMKSEYPDYVRENQTICQ